MISRSARALVSLLLMLGWAATATAADNDEPTPASASWTPPRAVLIGSVFAGLAFRDVSYRDKLTPGLAGYGSGPLELFGGTIELTPAARTELPFLRDLSVFGAGSASLASTEATFDNDGPETSSWDSWEAGLKWHGVFHDQEWLALSASYGWSLDSIGPGLPEVLLPGGVLAYVRPGFDVRVPLGRWAVFAGGGYRWIVRDDEVGHYFPSRSVGGIDARLGGTVALLDFIELRLSASYVRYFYSLNPVPGDTFVAGGALDERGVVDLSFVFRQ